MNKIHSFFLTHSKIRFGFFFLAAYILCVVLFYTTVTPVGNFFLKDLGNVEAILDLQKGYSTQSAFQFLESIGDSGRKAFVRNLLVLDFIIPLIMVTSLGMFISVLLRLCRIEKGIISYLLFLPMLALFSDYIENILHIILALSYPVRPGIVARAGSIMNICKWVLYYVSEFAVFGLLLVYFIRKIAGFIKARVSVAKENM